jgi:hypothetical protein
MTGAALKEVYVATIETGIVLGLVGVEVMAHDALPLTMARRCRW